MKANLRKERKHCCKIKTSIKDTQSQCTGVFKKELHGDMMNRDRAESLGSFKRRWINLWIVQEVETQQVCFMIEMPREDLTAFPRLPYFCQPLKKDSGKIKENRDFETLAITRIDKANVDYRLVLITKTNTTSVTRVHEQENKYINTPLNKTAKKKKR